MSLFASHRLPTVVRHFLECRAIVIALRHLRRLRSRSGADPVEQLTDKPAAFVTGIVIAAASLIS
jgi:hypothetical protein